MIWCDVMWCDVIFVICILTGTVNLGHVLKCCMKWWIRVLYMKEHGIGYTPSPAVVIKCVSQMCFSTRQPGAGASMDSGRSHWTGAQIGVFSSKQSFEEKLKRMVPLTMGWLPDGFNGLDLWISVDAPKWLECHVARHHLPMTGGMQRRLRESKCLGEAITRPVSRCTYVHQILEAMETNQWIETLELSWTAP